MDVIVITPPKEVENEHEEIHQLFKAGLRILHVRKPDMNRDKLKEYIKKIPEKYHSRLVLHSYHRLAFNFKLRGIHLTEKHRKTELRLVVRLFLLNIFRPGLQISASVHSLKSLEVKKTKYNYVLISPVFDSISKEGQQAAFSLAKLKDAVESSPYEVYGLGGIDESKISFCKDVGFFGIALLGSVWESDDPAEKYKTIRDICNPKPRPIEEF